MNLFKKTTATVAVLAIASGFFATTSAYSQSELQAAEKLANAGMNVVKRTNPADYQLDRQVLRQEIAAVSLALAGLSKSTTCNNMFTDVSATNPNDWACKVVEPLANNGYVTTANSKFRPEDNITKAEAVGMIIKAAYKNEYTYDSSKGDWQKQTVDFAVSKGIVSNFTNYTTPATRGFVFEVASKTLKDDFVCNILGGCENNPTNNDKTEEPVVAKDGTLAVALSAQTPANGTVAANSARVPMLAFTVTASKKADVTLKSADLKFTGLGDSTHVRDLAIYSDDVKITKGSDKKFNSKNETTLSFDRDVVIKA